MIGRVSRTDQTGVQDRQGISISPVLSNTPNLRCPTSHRRETPPTRCAVRSAARADCSNGMRSRPSTSVSCVRTSGRPFAATARTRPRARSRSPKGRAHEASDAVIMFRPAGRVAGKPPRSVDALRGTAGISLSGRVPATRTDVAARCTTCFGVTKCSTFDSAAPFAFQRRSCPPCDGV